MKHQNAIAAQFFHGVLRWRHGLWPLLLALPLYFSMQALQLEKDIRSDAFIARDNPALRYRDVIRERFGLEDPMLVAVVAEGQRGIFTIETLSAVQQLTDALNAVDNIKADETLGMTSVSTLHGTAEGLDVIPVLDEVPETEEDLIALKKRIAAFPLFHGSLVAKDGSATLIVLQLDDGRASEDTYRALVELVDAFELPAGVTAHVAGEGAVTGYLGAYVDADARKLNPIAALIIIGIITLAFRRAVPPILSICMIVASVSIALGAMAISGIPFYVVTNALPVILIGIAVADTIHVCNHLYLLQTAAPKEDRHGLIVETLCTLWRPITITSVTTIAGFLGLYFASDMPPFKYFGLFTALGVLVAWLYSLIGLPILLAMTRATVHPSRVQSYRAGNVGLASRLLMAIGRVATTRPRATLLVYAVVAVLGLLGATRLKVDDDRIGIFHPSEKIAIANTVIQEHLGGTGTLDVVVETSEPEGILNPDVLAKIDQLQRDGESLPGVSHSRSIVDYLKQMNRVLSETGDYVVPDTAELAAQFLLLYSFSGDTGDFSQLIDFDYQTANIRYAIAPGDYQSFKPIVEQLDQRRTQLFSDADTAEVSATLSGRVSLDYHWLQAIQGSHTSSLLGALVMVLLVSAMSFRSLKSGLLSLIPVLASVLAVYAIMALRDIPLGVGTSMFAAVAIGLGIDFAIHTLAGLSRAPVLALASEDQTRDGETLQQLNDGFFAETGQALLLNFLAVASGFAVLMVSEVSQLADFGRIVLTAVGVSFIASVTILPAWNSLNASEEA